MSQSIGAQIKKIKDDVRNECKKITRKCAKQACEDLSEAHGTILDSYYNSYDPKYYKRTFNLYNSLLSEGVVAVSNGFRASVVSTGYMMNDNYKISPDYVFGLVWNEGIRGLRNQNLPRWDSIAAYRGFSFHGSTPHEAMVNAVNGWGATMQGLL